MTFGKKLIEVALPLDAINKESLRRKQKAPKGWPTTFHKWWAQRPMAAQPAAAVQGGKKHRTGSGSC
jgi:adenine-specific DNA methylase